MTTPTGETLDDIEQAHSRDKPEAGLLVLFSSGTYTLGLVRFSGDRVVLGRDALGTLGLHDAHVSRPHASVRREGGRFVVEDLGSRNGTFVDGVRIAGPVALQRVLRVGQTVCVITPDARPFVRASMSAEGMVIGPGLESVLRKIDAVSGSSRTLFVQGETGSGKELAARRFHAADPTRTGRLVAVNCATVPSALAERLFFGTMRGVYSGATEQAQGWFQAADRGTLFLDELAELELSVQSKLLRVLESGEVHPLGATKPQAVDVKICVATHASLDANVAAGRFRADLYHRIATPSVRVPPLRERPEELPYLVQHALRDVAGVAASAGFLEACLRRPWPGNVRQLLAEVRDVARTATTAGRSVLSAEDLPHIEASVTRSSEPESDAADGAPRAERPTTEQLTAALAASGGNVSDAARRLGVHRTQLRRWLERDGVEVSSSKRPTSD